MAWVSATAGPRPGRAGRSVRFRRVSRRVLSTVRHLESTAGEHGVFLLYAGLAGFEGGKGMTGSSRIVNPRGETIVEAPALGAQIIRAALDLREIDLARASLPLLGDLNAVLPDLLEGKSVR